MSTTNPRISKTLQQLPAPPASAQEMVRRGCATQDQLSSLCPGPQQPSKPRETKLLDFAGVESPPDADCDWSVPLCDENDKANVAPVVMLPEPETVKAVPLLSGAARTRQGAVNVPAPVAVGNEVRRRESDTDKLLKQWLGLARTGLLMCTLFLGGLFVGDHFFGTNSAVPPVAGQESREANASDPARAVNLPLVPPIVLDKAQQRDNLLNGTRQKAQPAVPAAAKATATARAPARAHDARPRSTASLYDRVRQVVLENKTEETQRLGMGDIAYQDVPTDGSILVGMEVTYAPFFTHQIIKSVRPIYQKQDGKRYDGPVCGTPTTRVGDRVVAKEGYAIGAATIKSGMGIDGMQLTFMEIGADGLNPHKTYLSKWLGGYGGSDAKTYLNDGRPIVGIAGMRSSNPNSPAFCLGLVTTRKGALADADAELRSTTVVAPDDYLIAKPE